MDVIKTTNVVVIRIIINFVEVKIDNFVNFIELAINIIKLVLTITVDIIFIVINAISLFKDSSITMIHLLYHFHYFL